MKTALEDWPGRSRELSALLARTGLGDRKAFATLYERTGEHLFAVNLCIQHDHALAEGLQEPLGTIRSWVRRALGTLRGCLERGAARDQAGSIRDETLKLTPFAAPRG